MLTQVCNAPLWLASLTNIRNGQHKPNYWFKRWFYHEPISGDYSEIQIIFCSQFEMDASNVILTTGLNDCELDLHRHLIKFESMSISSWRIWKGWLNRGSSLEKQTYKNNLLNFIEVRPWKRDGCKKNKQNWRQSWPNPLEFCWINWAIIQVLPMLPMMGS